MEETCEHRDHLQPGCCRRIVTTRCKVSLHVITHGFGSVQAEASHSNVFKLKLRRQKNQKLKTTCFYILTGSETDALAEPLALLRQLFLGRVMWS